MPASNNEKTEGLKDVALGMDAEAFMDSDLGREFLNVVSDRAIAAMDVLKRVKPSEFKTLDQFARAVLDLQNEVLRAETFEEWIVEVVETGHNTEQNLIAQEAEEN